MLVLFVAIQADLFSLYIYVLFVIKQSLKIPFNVLWK